MKNIDELIKTIPVVESNLQHISKNGSINGSLLQDIRRIMVEYGYHIKSECNNAAQRAATDECRADVNRAIVNVEI